MDVKSRRWFRRLQGPPYLRILAPETILAWMLEAESFDHLLYGPSLGLSKHPPTIWLFPWNGGFLVMAE